MDTDRAWEKWGKIDPYFGVLSDDVYRRERIDENFSDFFESGRLYVEEIMNTLERNSLSIEKKRALDFGCGVGRLSMPLARHFDEVVGVDVALSMLSEAKYNADRNNQNNLIFVQGDDNLNKLKGSFDLVNSYIVFQHIPVRRGMRIMRALLNKVTLNGVASIHVSLPEEMGVGRIKAAMRRYVPGLHGAINLYNKRSASEPIMEMNGYSLQAVTILMKRVGFGPMLVDIEMHGRFPTARLIARRTARTTY